MSALSESGLEKLLVQAQAGDPRAVDLLLECQRERLRRLAAIRLDARLVPRVDASDVVQETLLEASRRLPEYLESRPIPFYPWLRQIAAEKINKLHRWHLAVQKRSLTRERRQPPTDQSSLLLARFVLANDPSPSTRFTKAERDAKVRGALEQLSESDREIMVLRHLEQLSIAEIATVLSISETAAKSRHFRAIRRLQQLLDNDKWS